MDRELLDSLVCPLTKGPLQLQSLERVGDEVEFGVLKSEAGEYPVVAGIPVLFPDRQNIIECLRAGRFKEAVALSVIGKRPPAGIGRVARWLQETYRLKGIGSALERPQQERWNQQAISSLFPMDGSRPDAYRLLYLGFRQFGIRPPEVFNYCYYRQGLPSHLTALAYTQILHSAQYPVLDLGCGPGHITRAIQKRIAPQHVIGFDSFFFYLYVAKTAIAPDGWYVSGDVNHLPFRDGTFSAVYCSDAFPNFQYKWASLREMERTLTPSGLLMLIWLRNSLQKHLYPGRPLTPTGYEQLVAHMPHRVIPDSQTFRRYMTKQGVALREIADSDVLNREVTFSILAYKTDGPFEDQGTFDSWPHAEGILGINPIYIVDAQANRYTRQFPSSFYRDENPEIRDYMPESFSLSPEQLKALKANNPEPLDQLIRQCAVMGFAPGYLRS